jgi:catechol 2,3-dioxygenase-like lactoylglutathione lyase family enzyme
MARITGVHTVPIEVSDLDRSVAFWRDGLGIPLVPYGADEKNCHDAWIGGSHLLLHRDFSAATGRSKRPGVSASRARQSNYAAARGGGQKRRGGGPVVHWTSDDASSVNFGGKRQVVAPAATVSPSDAASTAAWIDSPGWHHPVSALRCVSVRAEGRTCERDRESRDEPEQRTHGTCLPRRSMSGADPRDARRADAVKKRGCEDSPSGKCRSLSA